MSEIDLGLVKGKDSMYKANVTGVSGTIEYSNGVKECWGYDVILAGVGYKDVELPITYTDNNFNPMVTGYQTEARKVFVQYATQNSIRVSCDTVAQEEVKFYYRCIGK